MLGIPPPLRSRRFGFSSADRPCCARTTPIIMTDRACAPQVRYTSPLFYVEDLYFLQYFPRLAPPPSELSSRRVLSRFGRIHIVIQPVGLIVELPSTTHSLNSTRTWTRGLPGLTLIGHPGSTEATHGMVDCLTALVEHYHTVARSRITLP